MPAKVVILAQFGHGYYIRGTFKRLMGVLAWLKAWWIRTRNPCPCCLGGEEMPAKVMILAQSGHGYYIRGTLKRLTDVVAWLKDWCIHKSVKRVTDQKSLPLLPRRRGNARKSNDFDSVWLWILYPWDFEEADGFFGLAQGLTRNTCHSCLAGEEMPAKLMILAQFDHGSYIHGTLKRLTDVVGCLRAWWISTRNPCPRWLGGEEMVTKVMILAQFGHGYYIRGTLKRLMGILACLKAWWIRFDHGYYIRGTLKRLMAVLACLKAWWIRVSVKQVTDQKSMLPLARWRGNAHKSHDFGSVWPRILYPWDFEETDGCFGFPQGLVDTCERETSHRPEIHAPIALAERKFPQKNPCHRCLAGEEMPAKVMILAQFDHGYYIRGTLQRLTDVVPWLKDRWICLKAWWIRASVKQVTDQKSMPLLPRRRGNAHDFGSIWPRILYPWDFEEADRCCGLPQGFVDQWLGGFVLDGSVYYIRETLKRLIIRTRNPCHSCLAGEEMPAKVMILAQFDHGYYIRGTLKRLMAVLACLRAGSIRTRNPCSHCPGGEEMPAKVMILAQFDHGYYIRGTLQRLTDVVAWLKAWWICVSVKQVTDQKSMPLLPRWGGKVVILAQFGHRYYLRGTLK
ncbi:hypothetical protein C8R44DRAFT_743843 [Mycena epipterygia]|nr:hypothetical protein C8R44DRAFT_743843 [Mycena epipterygia]